MVKTYHRPSSLEEALATKAAHPEAVYLAGGTFVLAGDYARKPEEVIDLSRLLPTSLEIAGPTVSLGAGATFQDLLDFPATPRPLAAAAASMVNRTVRARATVGGNVGAAKSCASLLPLFLALGARVRVLTGPGTTREEALGTWLESREGILLGVDLPVAKGTKVAFGRHSRTACDVSVLTVGVAYRQKGEAVQDLKVAMGGLGPRARLLPEVAALFEGRALPSREAIEAAALPHFAARDDLRGSGRYKNLRAAALLADALHGAEALP